MIRNGVGTVLGHFEERFAGISVPACDVGEIVDIVFADYYKDFVSVLCDKEAPSDIDWSFS